MSEVLETIADTRPDLFAVDPDQTAKTTKAASRPISESEQQTYGDDIPPLRPVVIEDDPLDEESFDD